MYGPMSCRYTTVCFTRIIDEFILSQFCSLYLVCNFGINVAVHIYIHPIHLARIARRHLLHHVSIQIYNIIVKYFSMIIYIAAHTYVVIVQEFFETGHARWAGIIIIKS